MEGVKGLVIAKYDTSKNENVNLKLGSSMPIIKFHSLKHGRHGIDVDHTSANEG
jgi:hypothetical protein